MAFTAHVLNISLHLLLKGQSSDKKSDALSIRPRGLMLMGQSKAHKLVWHGQRPLMAEGKEKF